MREMERRREIQKTAQIINHNFLSKNMEEQFQRLITNELNSDENFDEVYKEQLTYQLSLEDYDKCIKLRELVRS